MITPYQEEVAINLANRLLKDVWTPNNNDKLQKLSVHAIYLLLGEYLLSPNPDSYNPENFQVGLDKILDDTLNYMSNWELERNLSLVNNFYSNFNVEINNYKNKLDKELRLKEEKEFKKFLQNIPDLNSLTQHTIQNIPLIFLYRAQNHFIDSLNYAERAIFKSYEIAKILNLSFNLDSALQKLGFGSLKDFYVVMSLLFNGLYQGHGIFDLSICRINLEDDVDGLKDQKIKNLLSKVLGHISFDLTALKNSYHDMKEMEPKKEFIPFAHFNPFIKKPLLRIGNTIFLCPDFKCILAHASWGLLSEIRNVLESSEKEKFDKLRGEALEQYFTQFGLQRAEPKVPSSKKVTSSVADFFIKTPNRAYLVEVKNSLGLRSPIFKPKEHIKLWIRLWHAYNQCVASKGSEITHFIIVVDETVLIEATSFFLFAHHAKKIEISKVSLVSASLFTDLILVGKLDEFVEAQKERADCFIKNPIYKELMHWIETEQNFSINNNDALVQHYEPIKKELLPCLSHFVEEHLSDKPTSSYKA